MSHFVCMVIGNDWVKQLKPFKEEADDDDDDDDEWVAVVDCHI